MFQTEKVKFIKPEEIFGKPKGIVEILTYKAGTQQLLKKQTEHNIVMQAPNVGMDLIIQWLAGTNAYGNGGINYGALGTSSTTPLITDTQLGAEVYRVVPSIVQDQSNQTLLLQFYFPDTLLSNVTYYEFGTFLNATSLANSGQIFNHALFTIPYTKAAGTDVTVQQSFQF